MFAVKWGDVHTSAPPSNFLQNYSFCFGAPSPHCGCNKCQIFAAICVFLFLLLWRHLGDSNFFHVAAKLTLSLAVIIIFWIHNFSLIRLAVANYSYYPLTRMESFDNNNNVQTFFFSPWMFAHKKMSFLTLIIERWATSYRYATLSVQTKSHWKCPQKKVICVLALETTRERIFSMWIVECEKFRFEFRRQMEKQSIFCHRTNNVRHKNRKSVFVRIPNVCVWYMNLNRENISGKESHGRVDSAYYYIEYPCQTSCHTHTAPFILYFSNFIRRHRFSRLPLLHTRHITIRLRLFESEEEEGKGYHGYLFTINKDSRKTAFTQKEHQRPLPPWLADIREKPRAPNLSHTNKIDMNGK